MDKNIFKTSAIGFVTGFANGLFGSGGGTVVVPAMERFLDVKAHKAHATAIAVILPLSVISIIVYYGKVNVNITQTLFVSVGGMLGGFIGAKLLNKVPTKQLHKIFGTFMIAAGVKMIL